MLARSLLWGVLCTAACHEAPVVEQPELTSIPIAGKHDKVDLLFMIDNSPSMAPKQAELKARFPELLQRFQALASNGETVWYHIGVVTSDLGAGTYTLGGGQCHPGGDGGKLQVRGAAADGACQPPTGGVQFIDYNQIAGTDNLPAGQDLPTTFGCMASVGDHGCGFEQPLESVYRALHDPPAENHDFLRPDALLVVVFLTDEDDCSVAPDSDLFDPSQVANYGALLSYRCSNWGIACGGARLPYASSNGPLSDCHAATPAEGGKLTDVNRYIDFFTHPAASGGVKVNPADVILATLSGPENPVESILANPAAPSVTCAGPVDGMNCAVTLQHSCVAPSNVEFFGDPAVRLREVVGNAPFHQNTSICDTSYQPAMQSLGELMSARLTPPASCLPRAPLDLVHPTCQVADRIANSDGSVATTPLPACSDGAPPCWRIDLQPRCDSGYQLTIDRCLPSTVSYDDSPVQAACALVSP